MAQQARILLTLALLVVVCVWPRAEARADIVRDPYLQSVTSSSVVVVWRTDLSSPADSRVRFGASPGSLTQQSTGTANVPSSNSGVRDHVVAITGLSPATRYYYDAGTTSGGVEAGGTNQHYFVTAPAVGAARSFEFWVVGDSGNNSSAQRAVRDAMLSVTGSEPPDLFLHVGDMAYNTGTDSEFTNNHFAVYADVLRHTPFWPAVGNHEASSGASDSSSESGPYYEAFTLPTLGQAGGVASGTEAYYAFDYANVHVVVLDSDDSNIAAGSPQLSWLASDLASVAASQEWLVAMFHHPPYSKGSHDSDSASDSGGRLVAMRENVLPLLEAAGVDLVLSGHSHIYERSYLIDGAYGYGSSPNFTTPSFTTLLGNGHIIDPGDGQQTGDGAYIKRLGLFANEGTVYVVAGHGGSSLSGSANHPVMYFSELSNGSCLVRVDGDMLTLRNVRSDGAISDEFAIVKQSAACDVDADCDDADACTLDQCIDASCESSELSCPAGLTCNPDSGSCESEPETLTFRQGLNGYSGVRDTFIMESDPATPRGTEDAFGWDTDDPSGQGMFNYALLRFDQLFDFDGGPIPSGATIESANLSYTSFNSGNDGELRACSVDWSDATTYSSFGGDAGVQADEYGSLIASAAGAIATHEIDVTDTLQTWCDDPTSNFGWIVVPTGTDGVDVRSSEYATAASRPTLEVTFSAPALPCSIDSDCDDGSICTTDACIDGACDNAPISCDDSDNCTADTCDPVMGCSNSPLSCDDGDLCTADSCGPGGCQSVPVSCGPGETCDPATGICELLPPFYDDFSGNNLDLWVETGEGDWNTEGLQGAGQYPADGSGAPAAHIDNCDSTCTLTVADAFDLTAFDSATLSFLRYVGSSIDNGEYLRLWLWNGASWDLASEWTNGSGDDNSWHGESYDLSSYLGLSDFQFRFEARMSSSLEHVLVDDVLLSVTATNECALDVECSDDDACTTDSCDDGTCINMPEACSDGDPCTSDGCDPDTGCDFTPLPDTDTDGVCDALDECQGNDALGDEDSDGVCDDLDQCQGNDATGDDDSDGVCDDQDQCLGNDASDDSDGDGVCDDIDLCAGDDASGDEDLDGICDDSDFCFGTDASGDSDLDGVCDDLDQCSGDDASGDVDDDGICGDLDACSGDDATGDSDDDAVCDDLDACVGDDATGDSDADGTCDDLDPCFGDDATGDSDSDGVCDDTDACLGDDTTGDVDGDQVCDDLDACVGDDATGDSDNDGLCDDSDVCDGDNGTGDSDVDGVCDNLDPCALDPADGCLCGADIDCDDADECTDDTCVDGICESTNSGSCEPPSMAFVENDGLLVIEAEHFDANTPQGSWDWMLENDGAASGGQVMRALPDSGTINNTGYTTSSPRLDYSVLFSTPGTYTVWILGRDGGPSVGSGDSIHLGLNGATNTTADRISGFTGSFAWTSDTMDNAVATLTVSEPGLVTLNAWMREDGFVFDKLLLSTDPITPSGSGPDESPRDDCSIDADCDDGNICNGAELCTPSGCAAGPALVCDDGDACTFDSCEAASGCVAMALPDGDADGICDAEDPCPADSANSCVCSIDADCDDGNPCTDDTCGAGICQFDDNGSCEPGPFVETDGLLVVEAESFEANTPQGSWDWVLEAEPAGSGSQVMRALPDSGAINNTGYTTNSPRLDYPVMFTTPGTYFVWVLGRDGGSTTGSADSIHIGINGAASTTADRISDFTNASFGWANDTMDNAAATLTVGAAGETTLNAWMREDGFVFDKLLLTTDPSFTPSGFGPPESSRNSCSSDAECDDGNVCNGAETCSPSGCVGGAPLVCNDADPCTADSCDPTLGCSASALPDSDGDGSCDAIDLCTGNDASGDSDSDGVCDDIDACAGNDATGDSDSDGVCDDSDACTGNDAAGDSDSDGICDDLDECTSDVDCDDGDACNGVELCEPSGCVAGTPLVCDDSDPCTVDSCDSATGCTASALPDTDGDGACDAIDACMGDDATGDTDSDGVCDDIDACTGDDASGDTDSDGVCDDLDQCPGDDSQCDAVPEFVSFQQGVDGYSAASDTFIMESQGSSDHGGDAEFGWDTDDPSGAGQINHSLLRFGELFESEGGLIPDGSTIQNATLSYTAFNSGADGELWESAVVWDDTANYNGFGGDPGVQSDELRREIAVAPGSIATHELDVTLSLQLWSSDPSSNLGWVIVPTSTDGVDVRSSEYGTVSQRPQLTVEYLAPSTSCSLDAECDDGSACTTDTCAAGTCLNLSVACDDSDPCTADSCDAGAGCVFAALPDDDLDGVCNGEDFCTGDDASGDSDIDGFCDDIDLCEGDDASGDSDGDGECDDFDPCPDDATDACVCSVDQDCDDGDPCTDDTCPSGTCSFSDNGSCAPGPFVEVGGLVVMEAESFETNTPQGSWDWVFESDAAASGGSVMHALPDSGTINNTGYTTSSPRLDFPVVFSTPGTYRVWVRGRDGGPSTGSADSVHVGLNGVASTTADRISDFTTGSFGWANDTMDDAPATLTVSQAGLVMVNVWMREDGFVFDKLLFALDTGFTPSGLGPDESERGSGSCSDGEVSGDETDVDCGGDSCGACDVGEACILDSDCLSDTCLGGFCAVEPAFNIEVRHLVPVSPSIADAFASAAARWEATITGDLADVGLTIAADACGSPHPAVDEVIDDLVIFSSIEPIDGPGAVLGSAGPCYIRTSNTLPILGVMRFDTDDLASLEASGLLEPTITHEMGHVLGLGTLWDSMGLLVDPSTPENAGTLDTHFSGATAESEFDDAGGTIYGGAKVPVENALGGLGTLNGHWREGVFESELMTGYIDPTFNPLSRITVGALEDMGFVVGYTETDPYALPLGPSVMLGPVAPPVELVDDIHDGPIFTADEDGNTTRVR